MSIDHRLGHFLIILALIFFRCLTTAAGMFSETFERISGMIDSQESNKADKYCLKPYASFYHQYLTIAKSNK